MLELMIGAGAWIARLLFHFLFEIVLEFIVRGLGRLLLRAVTFGRYPRRGR